MSDFDRVYVVYRIDCEGNESIESISKTKERADRIADELREEEKRDGFNNHIGVQCYVIAE